MAAGYADILSLLGVWLGGRLAIPAATVPRTIGGKAQDWPRHRGHARETSFAIPPVFQDADLVALVKGVVEQELERELPISSQPANKPAPVSRARVQVPGDSEIQETLNRLFAFPALAAIEQQRIAEARVASLEAVKRVAEWQAREAEWLAAESRERDDEEALLVLL